MFILIRLTQHVSGIIMPIIRRTNYVNDCMWSMPGCVGCSRAEFGTRAVCSVWKLVYNLLYYYQRSTCFRRYFRPSSGAYKTVFATLGIVMLFCPLPLVWMGWNPWQYPRLHIRFYKLLMMGGNTAWNM